MFENSLWFHLFLWKKWKSENYYSLKRKEIVISYYIFRRKLFRSWLLSAIKILIFCGEINRNFLKYVYYIWGDDNENVTYWYKFSERKHVFRHVVFLTHNSFCSKVRKRRYDQKGVFTLRIYMIRFHSRHHICMCILCEKGSLKFIVQLI